MRLTAVLAAAALLAPAGAVAQSTDDAAHVLGTWEISYETRRGPATMTIVLTRDGDTFAGTAETRRGTTPLSDITIEGNQFSFVLVRGRGERTFRMQFTGTVDGDTASGTMTNPRGGEIAWTATRPAT